MKQVLEKPEYDAADPFVLSFAETWKKRKGYTTETLSLGECIELMVAVSYNLHHDWSDGRFFNHILTNELSIIAWDGEEPIDVLWYEIIIAMKRRIANAGTTTVETDILET